MTERSHEKNTTIAAGATAAAPPPSASGAPRGPWATTPPRGAMGGSVGQPSLGAVGLGRPEEGLGDRVGGFVAGFHAWAGSRLTETD